MNKILVTGSGGNLGTALCLRLLKEGCTVIGVDIDARKDILGASVEDNVDMLCGQKNYTHRYIDIVGDNWDPIRAIFPDVIIHCAAQVSHPKSIEIPMEDFTVNAYGTIRLLEYTRRYWPQTQFIHIGTAKIYGQNVDQRCPLIEKETRYVYAWNGFEGITEHCSFDHTMKTPFGCSKACADLYVQEYGKLYGLQTSVLRPGVFTGPYAKPSIYQNWLGHKMYEILNCGNYSQITNIGWKGKQVRDILHTDDLVNAIMLMIERPPPKGEVYNIGGGMNNAISVNEACTKIFEIIWGKQYDRWPTINYAPTREGDWCVYVTDNSKLMKQYPEWKVTRDLDYIIHQTYSVEAEKIDKPVKLPNNLKKE